LKLQNWVLELWSNYEIATDRFFHLRLPAPRPRRRRTPAQTPPGRPRVAPQLQTAPAPLVLPQPTFSGAPELATPPFLSCARHEDGRRATRLAAPSPAAPTPVDRFPARPDPPPLHRAPIKRAIALPARAQEGRPCHGRRQARLTVEPPPPPLLGSNRDPEWIPLSTLMLPSPNAPSLPHPSSPEPSSHGRRPCTSPATHLPAAPDPSKTTIRCASVSSLFSPTNPSPPANPSPGNAAPVPSSVPDFRQGPPWRRNKSSRGPNEKLQMNSKQQTLKIPRKSYKNQKNAN